MAASVYPLAGQQVRIVEDLGGKWLTDEPAGWIDRTGFLTGANLKV